MSWSGEEGWRNWAEEEGGMRIVKVLLEVKTKGGSVSL